MIRNVTLRAIVLLVALAANAFAGEGGETQVSHTISLWAGSTPAQDVIGARYQLHAPLGQGHHWTVSPGLGYGYGSGKDDGTSSLPGIISPATYQTTASYWDAMLDFLYYHGGDDDAELFGGPGLFYSSLAFTEKRTGMNDVTYPYQTFGAQLTVGGGIPMGRTFDMTGGMTGRAGTTSFDGARAPLSTGESNLSAITYSTMFNVGLRVRF